MIIQSNAAAANIFPATPTARGKSVSQSPAAVGADQTQLTPVSDENLTAAGAPIQDEDEAGKSTESARQMIIAQNAMAMMAQANSMPLNAVRLLRQ